MWYIVKTISVQEMVAVERCRRAIPYAVADKIFSPSYESKNILKRLIAIGELPIYGYLL